MTAALRQLRAVAPSSEQPPPDLSYEWRERQRIAERDWASVHVAADRRPALPWFEQRRRTWR
jgi:hypothetical protein